QSCTGRVKCSRLCHSRRREGHGDSGAGASVDSQAGIRNRRAGNSRSDRIDSATGRSAAMIVPQNRLLFWVAAVVLPFATLAGVYSSATLISLALIGCLAVAVLCDALASFNSLSGIKLRCPTVIRASKDRPAKIELQIGNNRKKSRHLRIGLGLPALIEAEHEFV